MSADRKDFDPRHNLEVIERGVPASTAPNLALRPLTRARNARAIIGDEYSPSIANRAPLPEPSGRPRPLQTVNRVQGTTVERSNIGEGEGRWRRLRLTAEHFLSVRGERWRRNSRHLRSYRRTTSSAGGDQQRRALHRRAPGLIIVEGDKPRHVHLVLDGWACRYKQLPDGKRQIVSLFVPGDFCDVNVYILKQMDHSIGVHHSA